jgi:hypothetical protein
MRGALFHSVYCIWYELAFPIFWKILLTLDLVESRYNSIRLLNNTFRTPQRSTTSPQAIDRCCTADLAKKANPCLQIEEHKQEQERMQPKLQMYD